MASRSSSSSTTTKSTSHQGQRKLTEGIARVISHISLDSDSSSSDDDAGGRQSKKRKFNTDDLQPIFTVESDSEEEQKHNTSKAKAKAITRKLSPRHYMPTGPSDRLKRQNDRLQAIGRCAWLRIGTHEFYPPTDARFFNIWLLHDQLFIPVATLKQQLQLKDVQKLPQEDLEIPLQGFREYCYQAKYRPYFAALQCRNSRRLTTLCT